MSRLQSVYFYLSTNCGLINMDCSIVDLLSPAALRIIISLVKNASIENWDDLIPDNTFTTTMELKMENYITHDKLRDNAAVASHSIISADAVVHTSAIEEYNHVPDLQGGVSQRVGFQALSLPKGRSE